MKYAVLTHILIKFNVGLTFISYDDYTFGSKNLTS